MKIVRYAVVLLSLTLTCCGKGNNGSTTLNSTNKHPAGWVTSHRAAYQANPLQCQECHGADLKGGITKIDCFNQGNLPGCHANGHGPRAVGHALPFANPQLHGPAARTDLIVCQSCHGTSGGAGSNPRFNLPIGSLPTGCEGSGCHLPAMAHPKPWNNHGLAGNQANACALCHGATFGGGNGPACKECHIQLVAGELPVPLQCVSCHNKPPSGSAVPNRAGSHATHAALPELTGNCAACHNGGGYGSSVHQSFGNHTAARVSFIQAYNAKSGVATFDRKTGSCANVRCHGGQTTPVWGGSLNSLTDCLKCHTPGTGQYNGYVSGQHTFHLTLGLFCTDCHTMDNQTPPAHFSNLSSPTLNQPAAATMRSYLNYTKSTQATCLITTAPPPGSVFTACHSGLRTW